jgi:hypothetical protein
MTKEGAAGNAMDMAVKRIVPERDTFLGGL